MKDGTLEHTKEQAQEVSFACRTSKVVRIVTVPPVLVSALLVLIFFLHDGTFSSAGQLLLAAVFLVLIPLAAYPVSYAVPKLRNKGREGQRNLALILSFVGYTGAVTYGIVAQVSEPLLLIFLTYLLSVIILIVFNSIVKVRASGHACSTIGPLVFLVYFTGFAGVIPCVLIAVAVVWSSLYLHRHTVSELILGGLSALIAFGISWLLIGVL